MKKLALLLSFPILFVLGETKSWAQTRTDLCNIYGAVYIEPNRSFARYKVYIEKSEAFADLAVFKQSSALFADRSGQWYFTDNKSLATFSIYLVENKSMADFSVYFTPTESFAGCKD